MIFLICKVLLSHGAVHQVGPRCKKAAVSRAWRAGKERVEYWWISANQEVEVRDGRRFWNRAGGREVNNGWPFRGWKLESLSWSTKNNLAEQRLYWALRLKQVGGAALMRCVGMELSGEQNGGNARQQWWDWCRFDDPVQFYFVIFHVIES